ncbi:pilus assembly protein PilM [Lentisphaerota bacterium ZTH]|nr:pilus assembly protein PilM [Lentisphaerota bacterium]WET06868.1 pilus assembly protein PilM [Lentisphaerota bacterium ZTH]
MAKENKILAIDIGGDCLKIAQFSYPVDGSMRLEEFAFIEFEEELRENGFTEQFSKAFDKALEENRFDAKKVRVAISGQSAFARLSKLPPLGDDLEHINQIVEYEARQTVPFPMEEIVWDYQLLLHTEDDKAPKSGVKAKPAKAPEQEPEEGSEDNDAEAVIEDDQEEMEALFVAVKSDLLTGLTDIIQDAGKEILSIEIAPVAFYNAAKANSIGTDECDLLLNIGGRCSTLVFADKGRIFTRTISIAGYSITQQISKEFGIPFADAEELKRRHGFVALGGAYEEPDSEVAATVSKIARNVMTRLHGEINRSINVWRSQYGGNRPKRLFLGGGSSLMAYTPRFFNEKLRMPVEYLNAFQVVGLGENIDKEQLLEVAPMFSELIGVGLRHMARMPVEISLMPDSIKKYRALQRKKPFFYASAVSMILCLLIFYWGVARRFQFDRRLVERTKQEVSKINKMKTKVEAAYSKFCSQKQKYEEAAFIIQDRSLWIDIFNELENLIPDKMWLSAIEGVSAISKDDGGSQSSDDIFGGGRTGKSVPPPKSSEVRWLKITGHSLILAPTELLEESFKKKIQKCKYFDDGDNAVSFGTYKMDKGDTNVSYFVARIKLKKPIKI